MKLKIGLLNELIFNTMASLKINDIDLSFTGSYYTEQMAIKKGFKQLTGEELKKRIINKTICGDYPMGFTFVTRIYENGKTEGINNVGSQDYGYWAINTKNHTISLQWNNGWMNTTTHFYDVNGNIEFYDVDTGNWRTTFKKFENWKEE